MKQILLLCLALQTALMAVAGGRIEVYAVQSAILGVEKKCSVYLPEGYDASQRSYPVLYLLHGAGGCHSSWVDQGYMRRITDEAIAEGVALPMVVVMPDASGEGEKLTGRGMGYFNVPGWSYERFFFEELMPAIEKRYRIAGDKRHRAISGLSMGGGGTAVYALRRPDLFGSACPMSGLLDKFSELRDYDSVFMQSVADNSPLEMLRAMDDKQLEAARSVRWWVDCGDDDFLYLCNIRFYELMRQRKVDVQYRMRDGGHTWRYWQQALPAVLTFVSVGFAVE